MARQRGLFYGRVQLFLKRPLSLILLALLGLVGAVATHWGMPAIAQKPNQQNLAIYNSFDNIDLSKNSVIKSQLAAAENSLLEQGITEYQQGQFRAAIELWQQAEKQFKDQNNVLDLALTSNYLSLAYQQIDNLQAAESYLQQGWQLLGDRPNSSPQTSILAKILNTQGRLQLLKGQGEAALESWQKAETVYQQLNDAPGMTGAQINQAQALGFLGEYRQALKTLRGLEVDQKNSDIRISQLISLGNTYLAIGDAEKATKEFNKIPSTSNNIQAISKAIGLGNAAQALAKDKRYLLSPDILNTIYNKTDETNIEFYAKSLKIYTDLYQDSLSKYQEAESLSKDLNTKKLQAQLNQLTLQVDTYKWWLDQYQNPQLLNQSDFLSAIPREIEKLNDRVENSLSNLSLSQASIYGQINLANSLLIQQKIWEKQTNQNSGKALPWQRIEQLLTKALNEARELQDKKAEIIALGKLGNLHEERYNQSRQQSDFTEAENFTSQAVNFAKSMQFDELAYQWQWQLGRLRKGEGKIGEAIAFYTEAIENSQKIRQNNLVAIAFGMKDLNPTIQIDFRDQVEQVYRDLIKLHLQGKPNQESLKAARDVVQKLQLAQIENFLQCSLQGGKENEVSLDEIIDKKNINAAIFYPIVLEDELGVILKVHGQESLKSSSSPPEDLKYYSSPVSRQKLVTTLSQLRPELQKPYNFMGMQDLSAQVYDWLIRGAEKYLSQKNIDTLVFVMDKDLQNIPVASLYNKETKKYLIEEKYSVAFSKGREPAEFQPIKNIQWNALLAGLTVDPKDKNNLLKSLEFAKDEVENIQTLITNSKLMIGEEFTKDNVKNAVSASPYNLVHVATHGQFSNNPNETFIWLAPNPNSPKASNNLGSEDNENRVDVNELEELFHNRNQLIPERLELLVLSACETQTVDYRSAIGLAGTAIRAGARSTIASLWSLKDDSAAEFMKVFYQKLIDKDTISKADALRQAQLAFLKDPKYKHPLYWSPYVLVGNWL
jgi:CHAT domain-containing protein